MGKKGKKSIKKELTKEYKLAIYDQETLDLQWSGMVSKMKVYNIIGISALALITIVVLVIVFTPINRILPAYANSEMQQNILTNAQRLDSLEHEILIRDRYVQNIKRIISGDAPTRSSEMQKLSASDDVFPRTEHDSILRLQIEAEERFNVPLRIPNKGTTDFSNLHFFVPVKGVITNRFNQETKHFGVDIVAAPNEAIMAVLDGTVITATLTLSTGYVLEIQHANNIISSYKHNSTLLKQVGDHVKTGETIAIIGNTGELTTGPHLHFELWHEGTPLNPEDYIVF